MKMKVKVARLKDAISKHVKKDRKRFARETEDYKISLARANSRYVENVADYLYSLRHGGKRVDSSYEIQRLLEKGCKFPSEVKAVNEQVELLVKLDLAEDQILVVDDHSDYMKFLSGKCVCR